MAVGAGLGRCLRLAAVCRPARWRLLIANVAITLPRVALLVSFTRHQTSGHNFPDPGESSSSEGVGVTSQEKAGCLSKGRVLTHRLTNFRTEPGLTLRGLVKGRGDVQHRIPGGLRSQGARPDGYKNGARGTGNKCLRASRCVDLFGLSPLRQLPVSR